jgi:Fe-S-cluster containining protein
MRQEVLAMTENQSKTVFQSCLNASRKILDDRPKNFQLCTSTTANAATQVSGLSKWYAGLKLACPFLSGGLCTIYEQRPTACREHIVTGSPLLCEAEWTDESHMVKMPVSALEALGQLASELENTSAEAVMLPLALPWAQENLKHHEQTWPAEMMVESFVEIIKAMAEENSSAVMAPN